MPPRSSSPICERSLDLTLIGIGRRDIPQCSSKHFHMEAFYRTFSGGQGTSSPQVLSSAAVLVGFDADPHPDVLRPCKFPVQFRKSLSPFRQHLETMPVRPFHHIEDAPDKAERNALVKQIAH